MRTRIYQINPDRDVNRVMFLGYDEIESVAHCDFDTSIYDKVFDGDIPEVSLEDIFFRFNFTGHPDFKGHSLSVSDIVVNDYGTYYCDNFGWKKLDNIFG